ncbi:uncharacterized protein N7484_011973 [Penicillium longicatenatum]|uniref:uncharacterized protein n=1 Tax=Penicillium longicatenatum TaxID=1561947 RepID=UPI002549160F|nr:uncharacterized protein N7484_011973 [Penicillium longicatenatum]KAJ5631873.1 hypothetical protein N7484_011973 [Penicillium longicatenatum]
MSSPFPFTASPNQQSASVQYVDSPMPLLKTPFAPPVEQDTHINTQNGTYAGISTPMRDQTTLVDPTSSQMGQDTQSSTLSGLYTNQPIQWTAPTTAMEPTVSQPGQGTPFMVLNTPVKPSTTLGNPWPSPNSSTNSPHGNSHSTQSAIIKNALAQPIENCLPPQGPQGYMSDDDIWNEELRVGGPQLCALPANTFWFDEGSHYHNLAWSGNFLDQIYRLIHSFSIDVIEVMLVTRQSQWGLMPEPIVTLLIFATRKNLDDDWVPCARKIRKYLTTLIRDPSISVEIADPSAYEFEGSPFVLPMNLA